MPEAASALLHVAQIVADQRRTSFSRLLSSQIHHTLGAIPLVPSFVGSEGPSNAKREPKSKSAAAAAAAAAAATSDATGGATSAPRGTRRKSYIFRLSSIYTHKLTQPSESTAHAHVSEGGRGSVIASDSAAHSHNPYAVYWKEEPMITALREVDAGHAYRLYDSSANIAVLSLQPRPHDCSKSRTSTRKPSRWSSYWLHTSHRRGWWRSA